MLKKTGVPGSNFERLKRQGERTKETKLYTTKSIITKDTIQHLDKIKRVNKT